MGDTTLDSDSLSGFRNMGEHLEREPKFLRSMIPPRLPKNERIVDALQECGKQGEATAPRHQSSS
jgi:hypothetical protein